MLQQELGHAATGKLAYCVVGDSGGNGNVLSRHRDMVPNRLKDLFEFFVCPSSPTRVVSVKWSYQLKSTAQSKDCKFLLNGASYFSHA